MGVTAIEPGIDRLDLDTRMALVEKIMVQRSSAAPACLFVSFSNIWKPEIVLKSSWKIFRL